MDEANPYARFSGKVQGSPTGVMVQFEIIASGDDHGFVA
jgi:hypothetical protein